MNANEIEISTANVILIDYGRGNYPEFDTFVWQPSIMKYERIRPYEPVSEFFSDIIGMLIQRLFALEAVKDFSIQYEYPNDEMKGMPKHTAYLYLKEIKDNDSE